MKTLTSKRFCTKKQPTHSLRDEIYLKIRCLGILFSIFLPCAFIYSSEDAEVNIQEQKTARAILQIILEQPESFREYVGDHFYLNPDNAFFTHQGIILYGENSIIQIPVYGLDEKGLFLLCKNETVNKEAQKHYDKGWKAFLEALFHSGAAGASIEIPPLSIYEAYKAVENFKEAAHEYLHGLKIEGQLHPSCEPYVGGLE